MEAAQIPLRFILASRNDTELIKKVYIAQKNEPSKGDFCMLVESDMSLIDLNLSEIEMTDMTRYDLKIEVKNRTREAAIKYIMNQKETKSKMDGIEYSGPFDLQPYRMSPMFTREESSLLLAPRTRSVRGVKSDFGEMYSDKTCPLIGCMELDSLAHILVCSVLS